MSLIRWQDIRLTHRNQLHSLHTDNEQEKSELNNAIPFTVAEKNEILMYKFNEVHKGSL